MGSSPDTDQTAHRRLTEMMRMLDEKIDREQPGSQERLALLRQQANLSDRREALVSDRR